MSKQLIIKSRYRPNDTSTSYTGGGGSYTSSSSKIDTSLLPKLAGDNTFTGKNTFENDITINGNIIQNGSTYITNIETVQIKNNLSILNHNEQGDGVSGTLSDGTHFAGWKVDRGSAPAFYWGFNEEVNRFQVGKLDDLESVATIQTSPTAGFPVEYNGATNRLESVSAVRDSLKLGGRNSADYWHKDNSNKSDVDWNAKNINIYSAAGGGLHLKNESWIYFNNTDNSSYIRMNYASTANRIDFIYSGGGWGDLNTGSISSHGNITSTGLGKFNTIEVGDSTNSKYIVGITNGVNKWFIGTGTQTGSSDNELALYSYKGSVELYDRTSKKFETTINGTKTTGDSVISGYIGSPTYVSGFSGSGWRTDVTGNMTVDSLTVRKSMNVYELNINKIRSGNGSYWFSDGAKIKSVDESPSGTQYYFHFEDDILCPFTVGDVVRCQTWTGRNIKYYSFRVAWVASNGLLCSVNKSSKTGSGTPEAGDEIVRMGNTTDTNRQGAVYITSNDNNSPYIDIIDGVTSDSLSGKTKGRFGKLDGITSPLFGNLSGYGFWTENGYLEGGINAKFGKIANWSISGNLIKSDVNMNWGGSVSGLWLNSNPTNPEIMLYKSTSSYVLTHYTSADNWGIKGRIDGATMFQLGSTNQIAGCNFDSTHIWVSDKWRLNSDGSGNLAKGNISWDTSGNVLFSSNVKMSWSNVTGTDDIETTTGSQAKVDAIRIGGKNLLQNCDFESLTAWNFTKSQSLQINNIYSYPFSKGLNIWNACKMSQNVTLQEGVYTLSVYVRSWHADGYNDKILLKIGTQSKEITTDGIKYKRFTFTVTLTAAMVGAIALDCVGTADVAIARIKLERGDQATEDVDVDISVAQAAATAVANTAQSTANTATNKADAANVLAASKVTAEQATTISNNRIKVANLDAYKITTGILSADRIAANSIDASKINFDNATGSNLTLSGLFKSDNGTKRTQLNAGELQIYDNGTQKITIGTDGMTFRHGSTAYFTNGSSTGTNGLGISGYRISSVNGNNKVYINTSTRALSVHGDCDFDGSIIIEDNLVTVGNTTVGGTLTVGGGVKCKFILGNGISNPSWTTSSSGTQLSITSTSGSTKMANRYGFTSANGSKRYVILPTLNSTPDGTFISITTAGQDIRILSSSYSRLNWDGWGVENTNDYYEIGDEIQTIEWTKFSNAWYMTKNVNL